MMVYSIIDIEKDEFIEDRFKHAYDAFQSLLETIIRYV